MGNCNCPSDIVAYNGGFLCNEGQTCTITENMWSPPPNINHGEGELFYISYGCDNDVDWTIASKQGITFDCTDAYFGEDPKPGSSKVCCYQPWYWTTWGNAQPILDHNPYEFEVDTRLFYFGLILILLFLVLNIYWIIKMMRECNRDRRKPKQHSYSYNM